MLHLLPDGEGRFLTARNLDAADPGSEADAGEILPHLLDHVGALAAQEVQACLDGVESLGLELREGETLELRLDRIHADAAGERGVDFHRLARDALAASDVEHEMQRAACCAGGRRA